MTKVEIDNYKKALVEVEAVLDCLEDDAYRKIPEEIIRAIEENKNKDYGFDYDEDLDYNQWNLSVEAKALLYNIYKRYIANEEEKKYFRDKEKFELMQLEKQKSEKYNPDFIFKNMNVLENKEEHKELVEIHKEKWYTKFLYVIKHFFRRK